MKLSEACCGDRVIIRDFEGDEEILKKISAMGLRKGSQFEVCLRCGRNLLLRNHNSQFILSRDLADKIKVEVLNREGKPCEAPCLHGDEQSNCEDYLKNELTNEHSRLRARKKRGLGIFKKVCPFFSKK